MYRVLSRTPDDWGFQNQVFAWTVLQKNKFAQKSCLKEFGFVVMFSGGFGGSFVILLHWRLAWKLMDLLENARCKINGWW